MFVCLCYTILSITTIHCDRVYTPATLDKMMLVYKHHGRMVLYSGNVVQKFRGCPWYQEDATWYIKMR